VLTDTMMVEPGRLALTTTPSIFPSCAEDTVPARAAGPWLWAIAGWLPTIGKAARAVLASAAKGTLISAFPSRVAVVIVASRGSVVVESIFIRRSCRQDGESGRTENIASEGTDQAGKIIICQTDPYGVAQRLDRTGADDFRQMRRAARLVS
jgi:hypothetical protein